MIVLPLQSGVVQKVVKSAVETLPASIRRWVQLFDDILADDIVARGQDVSWKTAVARGSYMVRLSSEISARMRSVGTVEGR